MTGNMRITKCSLKARRHSGFVELNVCTILAMEVAFSLLRSPQLFRPPAGNIGSATVETSVEAGLLYGDPAVAVPEPPNTEVVNEIREDRRQWNGVAGFNEYVHGRMGEEPVFGASDAFGQRGLGRGLVVGDVGVGGVGHGRLLPFQRSIRGVGPGSGW